MLLEDTRNIALTLPEGKSCGTPTHREKVWLTARMGAGRKERFCEVVKLTPGLAGLIMERNTQNRPQKPHVVTKYATTMTEGRWKLSAQGMVFTKDGRLIDGQHRCAAVIESGCTVAMTIWFGCEEGEFDVLDGGETRKVSDLVAIEGLNNVNVRSALARAAYMLRTGRERGFDNAAIKAEAVRMDCPLVEDAIHAGMRAKRVCGVSGAALAYWYIAKNEPTPEHLAEFWARLCDGANLGARSPILRVREYFRNVRTGGGMVMKTAAAIVIAWNLMQSRGSAKSFAWTSATKLPEVL